MNGSQTNDAAQKVAAILLAIQPDTAARLLSGFQEEEVAVVTQAAGSIGQIEDAFLSIVGNEFRHRLTAPPQFQIEQAEILDRFTGAMSEDKRQRIIAHLVGETTDPETNLAEKNAAAIAGIIEDQRAQVGGAILASLPQSVAESVLHHLGPDKKQQCLDAMLGARQLQKSVQQSLMRRLDEDMKARETTRIDQRAIDRVAALCISEGDEFASAFVERVTELKPEWASLLNKSIVTFQSLFEFADSDLRAIAESVSSDIWVDALQGAPDEFIQRLLSSFPTRARKAIEQDMMQRGARLQAQDIEAARATACREALRLIKSGLVIGVERG